MAEINLDALETLEIQAWRTEDEGGDVTLVLKTDEGRIRVRVGRTSEDADRLAEALGKAHVSAAKVAEDWDDRPDEYDAYVSVDRGRWYVRLEGVEAPGQPRRGYPSRGIAVYELARAMADMGAFPVAWVEGTDWAPEGIDAEVRAFHDEGGDKLLPLPGVLYEPGDEVLYQDSVFEVVRDYGTGIGVWIQIPRDPEAGDDPVTPHDQLTPIIPAGTGDPEGTCNCQEPGPNWTGFACTNCGYALDADQLRMVTAQLLGLAFKYRDALVTADEYRTLREADLVNASGELNVAGTVLEPWLDEFPVKTYP
jgi:hypothetical protein